MELIVNIPESYPAERDYILAIILEEFLGLAYCVERTGKKAVSISDKDKKHQLIVPDCLFSIPEDKWLTQESLPEQPLEVWDPRVSGFDSGADISSVPVIYGPSECSIDSKNRLCYGQELWLPIDIFGSCFFMLTRYEEMVVNDRDCFDRFPANATLAQKAGFLSRPIVDEYVKLLLAYMKQLWPHLECKTRQGDVFVTCDVDQPYDNTLKNPTKVMKRIGGDLLKRHSPGMAVRSVLQSLASFCGNCSLDPYNTFDWMMDTCEKEGKKMAFFFLSQSTSEMDARYNLNEKFIMKLLKDIHNRGHEIGMHGSYDSYQNSNQIMKGRTALLQVCKSLAIDQPVIGNRQHYLRWDAKQTPDHLNAAGFEYDTSGSFADSPGFRYGTSHPFKMWSWQKKIKLKIKQRPLILMEGSVLSDCYLGMGYTDKALDLMLTLKKQALKFGGDFILLWHNSHFLTNKDREFYEALIG